MILHHTNPHLQYIDTNEYISIGHIIINASYLHKYLLVHTNFVLERTRCWLYGWFMSKWITIIQIHICNEFTQMIISILGISWSRLPVCRNVYWCTPIRFWKEPDAGYIDNSCLNDSQSWNVHICNVFADMIISLSGISWSMILICINIYWCTPILF